MTDTGPWLALKIPAHEARVLREFLAGEPTRHSFPGLLLALDHALGATRADMTTEETPCE